MPCASAARTPAAASSASEREKAEIIRKTLNTIVSLKGWSGELARARPKSALKISIGAAYCKSFSLRESAQCDASFIDGKPTGRALPQKVEARGFKRRRAVRPVARDLPGPAGEDRPDDFAQML